ncbi:hypothetical protein [Methylobacterium brachiatum]
MIGEGGADAVTGPVASDAGFANAAGASLTVSGRYALAGALDNAGTVTLTEGSQLRSGRVANPAPWSPPEPSPAACPTPAWSRPQACSPGR